MFDLKAKLEEEFIGVEIVKLKDLTKKIAVISKVRVGKERNFVNYDEVTLADTDEYGIIQIDSTKKKPSPANSSAIATQRLHKNDLLVSYRGLDIQVGRIDREYKQPVISNNSAIRIQFEYADEYEEEEVSIFVQAYLQLPYVKEYIAKRPQSSENNRKILGPLFLANIPIPLFHSRNYDFKELVNNRLKAVNIVKELLEEMQELKVRLENHKNDSLSLYLNSSKLNPEVKDQDIKVLKSLNAAKEKIEKQLKDL